MSAAQDIDEFSIHKGLCHAPGHGPNDCRVVGKCLHDCAPHDRHLSTAILEQQVVELRAENARFRRAIEFTLIDQNSKVDYECGLLLRAALAGPRKVKS